MKTNLFTLRMLNFAVIFDSNLLSENAEKRGFALCHIRSKNGLPEALLALKDVFETRVLRGVLSAS